MIQLESMNTKEEIIRDFYTWLFDDDRISVNSIVLEKELDISLAPYYEDPYIYYPKQIGYFFNCKAMKRLNRVSQLSLAMDVYQNLYHNRLEHSKGVYNRKLEEMIYNFQNPEWKKSIEDNKQKIYLLADLIKMAGHDIGHFPLSHLMEIEILSARGAHEILGKRIMLENSEIQEILTNISPSLPEILKQLYEVHIMNFNEHDESSYDVDRLDYLSRDYLYFGNPIYFQNEPYETVSVELDENGYPKTSDDFSIEESTSSNSHIDVYNFKSLRNIEKFLEKRLSGYKNIYSSPLVHIHEKTISAFFKAFSTTDSSCGFELKNFINNFKNHDINTVNLEEFLKWDDIKLYSQILEIAEKHPDSNIRALAIMTIPNMEAFLNMIYSHLELKKSESNEYSPEDIEFLKKIKHIIRSNDDISIALRNPHYTDQNTLFFSNKCEETNLQNYILSHVTVKKAYNPSEPIYIKDNDGKIYELSHHPSRLCDWNNVSCQLRSFYAYIPFLKFNGISEETINTLKKMSCGLSSYSNKDNTEYLARFNMQPLTVGHSIENSLLEIDTEYEK